GLLCHRDLGLTVSDRIPAGAGGTAFCPVFLFPPAEVIVLNIMGEIAIIFGICLVSEGISSLLPIPFPASVLSMLILLALLLSGVVQDRHIRRTCGFFTSNMAFFFIPPCVGILEHMSTL